MYYNNDQEHTETFHRPPVSGEYHFSASQTGGSSADGAPKPGFFQRIARWFREMKSELKKVVWPTPKQTVNNTVIVIICVIVVGICIWVFDWLAGEIVRALLRLFGKV
mgnify:CR=1 FL=1